MAYTIDLSGRVALVTGASSGLGWQFARTLAGAGAAVVLASRRAERLKELRACIEGAGGDAHVVALDVDDPASIRSACCQIRRSRSRASAAIPAATEMATAGRAVPVSRL